MNNTLRLWLTPLLITPLLLIATTSRAAALPSDADILEVIKTRIDVERQGVGIVVGVIGEHRRSIVSFGKADQQTGTPVGGDTIFEIGSVTKVFTAILLADMVERGEVKLTDPISMYLPKAVIVPSRAGKQITLGDLSSQVSGLPGRPTNLDPKDPLNPFADYSTEQMYAFLSSYELTRDVGAQYEYSNYAVGLLGHVLTLRAGTDYETLVRKRITGPEVNVALPLDSNPRGGRTPQGGFLGVLGSSRPRAGAAPRRRPRRSCRRSRTAPRTPNDQTAGSVRAENVGTALGNGMPGM
jgi:serine-type D-Ala-D-Ala carboxypeptidase/endopeptidase